jgi:hypothetical protein
MRVAKIELTCGRGLKAEWCGVQEWGEEGKCKKNIISD